MLRVLPILALMASLVSGASASGASWLEVRSDHFTVLTDADEQQGRRVLDHFERMRWIFQTLFPKANLDPAIPIVVLATRSRESFQSLEPEAYLAQGQMDLAGFFLKSPDTNYVLLRLDADKAHPFATVYHEYTHLQFAGMSEWIPLWLNEGLAEFFENTEIQADTVELGQPNFDDLALLRHSALIPLVQLFNIDVSSPYYHEEEKGSVFYAEVWALTHYLEVSDREHRTRHITEYISRLRAHEDPVSAAEKTFGNLNQLQARLQSYIRASSYQQLVLSNSAAPLEVSPYRVRALDGAESDVTRADVLANVGRFKEARDLLESVLRASPGNARAQESMGYLEFREGNRAEAHTWYGQAVKLDAENYLAHYYFAITASGQGGEEEDAVAESSLRTALRLKPGFAPACDRLALLEALHQKNPEEARGLSLRAIQLAPANFLYRTDAGSILMAMQDFHDAKAVTQAALRVAALPEQLQAARSRLAQLEQIEEARPNRMMLAELRADEQDGIDVVVVDKGPRHGGDTPNPTRLEAEGVISDVTCRDPFVIDFRVVGAQRSIAVHNGNYLALDLTAVGFTPKGDVDPCKDFEGRKARVEYADSPDHSKRGQVTAVELRN